MAAVRVLVDANVLFSRTTMDWLFLLRNETGGNMFTVATTEDVIAETLYNLRKKRPDVDGGLITNIRSKIVTSIDELLEDYVVDGSYPGPDPHDAHVHAAAVACQADVLLTCDTGWFDLGDEELSRLPYEPQTPDCFYTLVDDSAPEAVRAVTANQLGYYLSKSASVDLPEKLRKAGCPTFAQRVGKHLQTIPLPKPAGGASSVASPVPAMTLTGATFDATTQPMVASFVWEGQVPKRGSVLWQIVVHSGDRQTIRHLGYKIVDGQPSAQFVWDAEGAWQATPDHDADLETNRLTVRFNQLALRGTGSDWSWEGVLNVDGDDVGVLRP